MKKLLSLLLLALLLLMAPLTSPSASAASVHNYDKALDLKILGLFSGTDKGFELDKGASRLQGAIMLVRLLGKEGEARAASFSHPFKDVPHWADFYVGYLCKNGLTTGISPTAFGPDEPLTALQYSVMTLRALGYDDKKKDFEFSKGLEKAIDVGLLTSSEAEAIKGKSTLLRDDLAGMSYNALKVKLKGSDKTLLDKLVTNDGVVSGTAASTLGLYVKADDLELGGMGENAALPSKSLKAKNSYELFRIMRDTMYVYKKQAVIDISDYSGRLTDDLSGAFNRACDALGRKTDVAELVSMVNYDLEPNSSLTVSFDYRYTESEYKDKRQQYWDAINKARQIVGSVITVNMEDYDKELKLHDYIVNNTRYDYNSYLSGKIPYDSYTAHGSLVTGKAVCQGYSEAFKLLCDLSGLECSVVTGRSSANGHWEDHAWNMVKLGGSYYHVDTTFDDPVLDGGRQLLVHTYFNLTDEELSRVDSWDKAKYPACTGTKDNYYAKSGLLAGSKTDFAAIVKSALARRQALIEVKVSDYSPDVYTNEYISGVVNGTGKALSFSYMTDTKLGIITLLDISYNK